MRENRSGDGVWLRVLTVTAVLILIVLLVMAVCLLGTLLQLKSTLGALQDVDWAALTQELGAAVDAVQQSLDQLDMQTLNETIQALKTAVEPLANFVSLFD